MSVIGDSAHNPSRAERHFHRSLSEPFTRINPEVRVVVSRLRGRAVRLTSHDSLSLGRFVLLRIRGQQP